MKWFLVSVGVVIAAFIFLITATWASLDSSKLTPSVLAGKQVWQSNGCVDSHTLYGNGAYLASDLTRVASRRGQEWLVDYFKERPVMPPSRTKRHPGLRWWEAENLYEFLRFAEAASGGKWPPKPAELR